MKSSSPPFTPPGDSFRKLSSSHQKLGTRVNLHKNFNSIQDVPKVTGNHEKNGKYLFFLLDSGNSIDRKLFIQMYTLSLHYFILWFFFHLFPFTVGGVHSLDVILLLSSPSPFLSLSLFYFSSQNIFSSSYNNTHSKNIIQPK